MASGTRCSGGGKLSGRRAQPVHKAIESSARVGDRVTNPDCSARGFAPNDEGAWGCVANPGLTWTDTKFPAHFAGNWLSVPGFAPRDMLLVRCARPQTTKAAGSDPGRLGNVGSRAD